jgi:uncharacterized protein
MQRDDYMIAREIKEKVSAFLDIVDFRVFGSRAREDHDPYSDMDVFIEVESLTGEQKERIYDITWLAGFNHTLVISPIICTRVEIEQSPLRASPFLKNILSEGVRV